MRKIMTFISLALFLSLGAEASTSLPTPGQDFFIDRLFHIEDCYDEDGDACVPNLNGDSCKPDPTSPSRHMICGDRLYIQTVAGMPDTVAIGLWKKISGKPLPFYGQINTQQSNPSRLVIKFHDRQEIKILTLTAISTPSNASLAECIDRLGKHFPVVEVRGALCDKEVVIHWSVDTDEPANEPGILTPPDDGQGTGSGSGFGGG